MSLAFADLGSTPIANDFLTAAQVDGPEPYYPLRAFACRSCRLVQLQDFFRGHDLFRDDYVYFSSVSSSWLAHAKRYAETMATRFGLGPQNRVVEVASNDGYLLQYFKAAGIPVLGIEPSRSVAEAAIDAHDIPTEIRFFGVETARELAANGLHADLMVANNVLAHVPAINDFVGGFAALLKPEGVATFEFPHLLNLIARNQFDTIYHEHFSYLSLLAVEQIFAANGLRTFDVEELSTHGGSLRVFACRPEATHQDTHRLEDLRHKETAAGLDRDEVYERFDESIRETKRRLLTLLIELKRAGKRIAAYGAPAKGNTLLNFCGIGSDMIDFTVDRSPHKQGLYLPGSRLPVLAPAAIEATRPDYVLILPWNLQAEIIQQLAFIRAWGGRFIVPIPEARILD